MMKEMNGRRLRRAGHVESLTELPPAGDVPESSTVLEIWIFDRLNSP